MSEVPMHWGILYMTWSGLTVLNLLSFYWINFLQN